MSYCASYNYEQKDDGKTLACLMPVLQTNYTLMLFAYGINMFSHDMAQIMLVILICWHHIAIMENSPCVVGNFRKWLLYKCFMSLSLIVIQTNIKFLKITVTWTSIW